MAAHSLTRTKSIESLIAASETSAGKLRKTLGLGSLVALGIGSVIGSGTVSNGQDGLFGSSVANGGVGYCCIAEVRMYETIEEGKPKTPFMRFGDRVRIEMRDGNGASIFGAIDQAVERYVPAI